MQLAPHARSAMFFHRLTPMGVHLKALGLHDSASRDSPGSATRRTGDPEIRPSTVQLMRPSCRASGQFFHLRLLWDFLDAITVVLEILRIVMRLRAFARTHPIGVEVRIVEILRFGDGIRLLAFALLLEGLVVIRAVP